MRLHSTSDEFMGKEPWKYSAPARDAAVNAMRGRHAMIPYIYSMNRRTHEHGIALCEPAYYTYPDDENAYKVKNEYFFGSELLVVPITSPADKLTNLAWADVWLPEGRWTDIYTGYIYDGGQTVKMFRDISSIPVLAKEGAILPLSTDDRSNDCSNPSDMTLRIWRGKGEFKFYEDDGETTAFENGCYAVTRFRIDETGKDILFTASKAEGEVSVLPSKRILRLCFDDVKDFDFCEISKNGKVIEGEIKKFNSRVFVVIPDFSPEDEIVVKLSGTTPRSNESKKEMMINRLSGLQMSTIRKRLEFSDYIKDISKPLKTKNKAVAGMAEEIMAMK